MADYSYDEKRDFARMGVEIRVTYLVKNTDDTRYHAISNDLSANGLSMKTDRKLTVGDEIEIVMETTGDSLPSFIAEGSVLRVDKNSDGSFNVSISLSKTS